jgi:hypothetical protein
MPHCESLRIRRAMSPMNEVVAPLARLGKPDYGDGEVIMGSQGPIELEPSYAVDERNEIPD